MKSYFNNETSKDIETKENISLVMKLIFDPSANPSLALNKETSKDIKNIK